MTNFNPHITPKAHARFMSYVDTTPGQGQCWPWRGGRSGGGYGRFNVPKPGKGYTSVAATRVMMYLMHGAFNESLVVRHTCDNPPCVNPEHLLLGTRLDNAKDMTDRQRQARGELHPKTTLTERIVVEIRRRALGGEPFTSIARDMGLNINTVISIAKGRTWKHVPGDVVTEPRRLNPTEVAEARRRVARGESIQAVAGELGIKYPSLVTAVRGRHPRWAGDIEGVPPVAPKGASNV